MDLQNIFTSIEQTEQKVLPLFIHNPASQQWAGLAFVAEDALFSFIERLHAPKPVAVAVQAAA